jgi:hypothetical protein
MKLSPNQTDVESLAQLGREAAALLAEKNFIALGERFGYALAYERDIAKAIENDLNQCLAEAEGPSSDTEKSVEVKYFKPNDTSLYALVECVTPVGTDAAVLVELIVTGSDEKHITLEDISYVT